MRAYSPEEGFPVAFFESAVKVGEEARNIELVGIAERKAAPVLIRESVNTADPFSMGEGGGDLGTYQDIDPFYYQLSGGGHWSRDGAGSSDTWDLYATSGGDSFLGLYGWDEWYRGAQKIKFHLNPNGGAGQWKFEVYANDAWLELGYIQLGGQTVVTEFELVPDWSLVEGITYSNGRMASYSNAVALEAYITRIEYIPPPDPWVNVLDTDHFDFSAMDVTWNETESRADYSGDWGVSFWSVGTWAEGLANPGEFKFKANPFGSSSGSILFEAMVEGAGYQIVESFSFPPNEWSETELQIPITNWPEGVITGVRFTNNAGIASGGYITAISFPFGEESGGAFEPVDTLDVGDATKLHIFASHSQSNGTCKVTPVLLTNEGVVVGILTPVDLAAGGISLDGKYMAPISTCLNVAGAHKVGFHVTELSEGNTVNVFAWTT